jgi:hypothetical protein
MQRRMLVEQSRTPTKRRPPPTESPTGPIYRPIDSRAAPKLGLPFTSTKSTLASTSLKRRRTHSSTSSPLPPCLASLVSLHNSLESALVLHLGREGSALASSTSSPSNHEGEKTVRIPKLIDYITLKALLESGGKRFSETELAQLLWIWEGCGLEGGPSSDDEELVIGLEGEGKMKARGGVGFTITTTRTIGSMGKSIATYALGITLIVRQNPQLPLLSLVAPSSPLRASHSSSVPSSPAFNSPSRSPRKVITTGSRSPSANTSGSGRGSMNIVALWSQGSESRKIEITRRLREWAMSGHSDSSSSAIFPTTLPAIPLAPLPSLLPTLSAIKSDAPSPSKRKLPTNSNATTLNLVDLLVVEKRQKVGKVGSAKQRAQDLKDRVSAVSDSLSNLQHKYRLTIVTSPPDSS